MSKEKNEQLIKPIRDALADARLWWKLVEKKAVGHRLGQANVKRPDEMSPTEWDRALKLAVPKVVQERRQALEHAGVSRSDQANDNPGKLLIFEYEFTMNDGLAESETAGVIDVHNCPPSDFWLGFVPRLDEQPDVPGSAEVLVSWIPNELVEIVSRGIYVIAEGCLDWADSERWKNTRLGQQLLSILHGPR